MDIIQPDYYASGYNIMVPKSMNLKSWQALKDKPVCGIQGAYYNKEAAQNFGLPEHPEHAERYGMAHEFMDVVKGHGPCNAERIANRKRAHDNGAWVRAAATVFAAKARASEGQSR